jgi:hypothetical protein
MPAAAAEALWLHPLSFTSNCRTAGRLTNFGFGSGGIRTKPCSRILSNGYFTGGSTLSDSLVMASLVADINSVGSPQGGNDLATWQCMFRHKWASLGADFASIQFYDGSFAQVSSGNGAIFSAGGNVYAVFGSISPVPWPVDTKNEAYPGGGQVRVEKHV